MNNTHIRFFIILFTLFLFSVPQAASQSYEIAKYGAISNDKTDDTKAIQKAINECSENGGGTIVFPNGTWLTGTIFLKDNITILLEKGAVWQGINDNDAYPFIETKIMSREGKQPRRAMIYGYDLENIKIYGEGTIYPGGDYPVFKGTKEDKKYYFRPFGIHLVGCKNIVVEGITMRNSAFWMQRYFCCDNVRIQNINVFNHSNLNNDGLDIDGCHNVLVDNCIIDSSDDAICLKSESPRACEDVTINNCILSSHASAVKCGTGSIGGFKRITVSNIVIRPSKSTEMKHVLKQWGGLAGIDLLSVDGGVMEDITISNIVMDSIQTPILIKAGNRNSVLNEVPNNNISVIRNIIISNVIAKNAAEISSSITGFEGQYVENIKLSDMIISVRGSDNPVDTNSVVPEHSDRYPFNQMFGSNLPAYGFFIRHAKNITLDNIQLMIQGNDYRSAIYLDDVHDAFLRDLWYKNTINEQPVQLVNSSGIDFR